MYSWLYLCYIFVAESRKRTGGSESGGGMKKKKMLSISADEPA